MASYTALLCVAGVWSKYVSSRHPYTPVSNRATTCHLQKAEDWPVLTRKYAVGSPDIMEYRRARILPFKEINKHYSRSKQTSAGFKQSSS